MAVVILAAGVPQVTGRTREKTESLLTDLINRLKSALGDRLVSLILYGSGAEAGQLDPASDLNVLCVLDRITTEELAKSSQVFHWWLARDNPSPLLLTEEEVRTSADCFPMEYHDMREKRRVLFGVDVIDPLQIENSAYRIQVEHELRTKQIRLRQKAAELLGQNARLQKLLIHSVSTFCVLGRHALILSGNMPRFGRPEIVAGLETALGRKLDSFRAILGVRESGKVAGGLNVKDVLDGYLAEIDVLVRFVDGIAK